MKVYIVRHGEVATNALKIFNTETEDLNEKGIEQAKELREKIQDISFDIMISSPLVRARHTAEIINSKNIPIQTDERLRERNPESLAGQPYTVTDREDYWNYDSTVTYGTNERVQPFFKRVHDFLDELKTKEYHSVLIVAHSGVSKAFSAYFEGIGDGMFLDRGLKNCEIKEYEL